MVSSHIEILLVEDSESDAELTLRSLDRASLGQAVHWVKDGEEALEYLFRTGRYLERPPGDPRLILLDLKLPKVGGLEVLGRLKSDRRTRHIPVVVLTSSDEHTDLRRCYDLHVNSYLVKPLDFERFSRQIGELGQYWLLANRTLPAGQSAT
ncbi:MAG TPA: response regulator [Thermoanaerobaculia bacterium]|nr:response regulator [Thermoanaerobaculia bacterium]